MRPVNKEENQLDTNRPCTTHTANLAAGHWFVFLYKEFKGLKSCVNSDFQV